MAGTEPEASNSTDLVSNNKEVTVSPSKFKKWRTGVKLEARYVKNTKSKNRPDVFWKTSKPFFKFRSTEGNDQWFLAKIQEIDKVSHKNFIF